MAQISYEKRIEFELNDDYDREIITEFGEAGFLISSLKEGSSKGKNEWKYERYDTNLELVQTEKVLLDDRLDRDLVFDHEDRTHSLYKDKKGNYTIVTVEAADLEVTKVEGILPKKMFLREMTVLGDYAFVTASRKNTSVLFSINWKTGDKKIIPITVPNVNPKKVSIDEFQVLKDANEIFIYVNAMIDKKTIDTYVIRLNDEGEKEETYNLTKNIDKNIVSVSASKLDKDQYIFTGTYSSKYQSMAEGIFFCQAKKDKIDFIEFHSFLSLKNFLTYLPEKKQEKIEKKKAKKAKRGKEFEISYRIAAHEIIPLKDGYLFLGEAFYPTYRTETRTTTSTVNGVTTTSTQTIQVFDGYQYTHAVLSKFDQKGKLLWDETFKLWSTRKPFYIKKFISIAEKSESSLKLVFTSRNKITSKSFDFDGAVLQESESDEIETGYSGDRAKYTFSNVEFWYDNYFLAYGQQKIKNKEEKGKVKRKRKVYFINKIKFE